MQPFPLLFVRSVYACWVSFKAFRKVQRCPARCLPACPFTPSQDLTRLERLWDEVGLKRKCSTERPMEFVNRFFLECIISPYGNSQCHEANSNSPCEFCVIFYSISAHFSQIWPIILFKKKPIFLFCICIFHWLTLFQCKMTSKDDIPDKSDLDSTYITSVEMIQKCH